MRRSWTDQDLQKIAGMMRDGMSSSAVAEAFRVTRNVIIGKVFRTPWLKKIGWKNSGKHRGQRTTIPSIAIAPNRAKNVRGGIVANPIGGHGPRKPITTTVAPFKCTGAPAPINVATIDRGAKQCAWPVFGSGEHMLMCGHDTGDILNSYCPHHRAQAYQPRQSMKVAA